MNNENQKGKCHRPDPIQYDNGLETNINAIVEQIFKSPPSAPNTIQLVLDHSIPDGEDFDDFEFQLLSHFTIYGMKNLFGPEANPSTLSESDFNQLNKYINSIGYNINYGVEETEKSYDYHISFDRYNSSQSKINNIDHLQKYMEK